MILNEYEREHDIRPVTEEFARSVAVDIGRRIRHVDSDMIGVDAYYLNADRRLHLIVSDGISLVFLGRIICDNPTIGQFWTACRLFGVTVKQQEEQPATRTDTEWRDVTPSSWDMACDWYTPDCIHMSMQSILRDAPLEPSERRKLPPGDCGSREFAEWMCHQYRLAMNKGIELERQRVADKTIDQSDTIASLTAERDQLRSKRDELAACLHEQTAWGPAVEQINKIAELTAERDGLRLSPGRVLDVCNQRGWSLHWTARGAYLHLESSELIEAIRGKRGDPIDEAGDVLIVLTSITENAGITWESVIEAANRKLTELETKPRYKGEEYTALAAEHLNQTHPVDGAEPIDEDWLRSIGAIDLTSKGPYGALYIGWEDDVGWLLAWDGLFDWSFRGEKLPETCDLRTREAVRDLLAALGVV